MPKKTKPVKQKPHDHEIGVEVLESIELLFIYRTLERIMATLADVQASQVALKNAVDLNTSAIADLAARIKSGGGITSDQLDAVKAADDAATEQVIQNNVTIAGLSPTA
jgi:hypothetical protein